MFDPNWILGMTKMHMNRVYMTKETLTTLVTHDFKCQFCNIRLYFYAHVCSIRICIGIVAPLWKHFCCDLLFKVPSAYYFAKTLSCVILGTLGMRCLTSMGNVTWKDSRTDLLIKQWGQMAAGKCHSKVPWDFWYLKSNFSAQLHPIWN